MTNTITPIYQNPCLTIGYTREDGDFRILATLSNIDGEFSELRWERIVDRTMKAFYTYAPMGVTIEVLPRQDAPDYIALEDDAQA